MKTILQVLLLTACTFVQAAVFSVTSNADAGAGTLRQAILDANASPGADVIDFSGAMSITLVSALPTITGPVTMNGTYTTAPQIELNGTTNNVAGAGLVIAASAPGTSIRGLVIHGHTAQGILISASNVTISGCFVGTNLAGTADRGNGASGIELAAGISHITIGGSTPDSSNVISGNNAVGINVAANSSIIRIAGNKIGLDVTGNNALGNSQFGILLNNNSALVIGGISVDERNYIGSNGLNGISVNNGLNVAILGNNIGIAADGTTARGNNGHGIMLSQCTNVVIGGNFASKNVISSNSGNGIEINNSNSVTIQYNFIGTTRSGLVARGNSSHGIQLNGNNSGVVIGGSRYVKGNIISANGGAGINFQDPGTGKAISPGSIVKGNLIGTDSTATKNFGNFVIGIILKSDNCIIGDTSNQEGNVLVGSTLFCGLLIANGNNNVVKGNYIGVGLDGTTPIGNTQDGINISVENAGQTASNNIVQYNTIAYNKRHGVNVGTALNVFVSTAELGNSIRFNKIYCNTSQGIYLNSTSTTKGNNGNETPEIDGVLSTSNVLVGVTNPQVANERIDIYLIVDCPTCDINPQGKIWLDSVIANAAGAWSFNYFAKFGTTIPGRLVVTATDASNNTSEFSLCCLARSGTTLVSSANPVCEGSTFNITYSNGQAGDSLMLQRSLDGIVWTNDQSMLMADPATASGIALIDTTWFRFVAFSNGPFASAQCTDTSTTIKVNYVLSPHAGTIQFLGNDSICLGSTFSLDATGTYGSLQWQRAINGGGYSNISGATTTSLTQTPSSSETTLRYRLIATKSPCGTDTSNVLIGKVREVKSGTIGGAEFTCDKTQYDLRLIGSSGVIQWQDSLAGGSWNSIGGGTANISYTTSSNVTTDYVRVLVSDSAGICPAEYSEVYSVVADTCSDALPVEIANAMTPNGDGSNDVFYIKNIELYPDNHLVIYNRWGNKVYDGKGYLNNWDGGNLPEATYYYLLELGKDLNGNDAPENKFEGTITILKK